MRLRGKSLLVSAAARGIGRACVERLAAEGARVYATDLDGDAVERMRSNQIEPAAVDSTDGDAVARHIASLPALDGVVHCVGFVHQGTVLECNENDWRTSFRINVDTFYHTVRAALPPMVERRAGSIVCISSVASSLKGLPSRAAYGATKAALIGMMKSVAADHAGIGIRCNAVCPGTVLTPSLEDRIAAIAPAMGGARQAMDHFVHRQPMGRLGDAAEVAGLCAYLMADDSAFVTGQAIAIDGGVTI